MLERLSINQQAIVGIFAAVAIAIVATIATKAAFGAYDPGYRLTARFGTAGQNLDTQSDVKIRGVNVGRVTGIKVGRDGRAIVTLHLNPGTKVPETAVAAIRPISIFGPKFVDLVPGSGEGHGPYLNGGDEIAHTETSLELNDVLQDANNLIKAINPHDLTVILQTLADGLDGLAGPLSQELRDARTVLHATLATTPDRHRLLDSLGTLSATLADHSHDVVQIAQGLHAPAQTLESHQDQLAGLLDGASRLSGDVADILNSDRDVLGPATVAGSDLSGLTANELRGLVGYLHFVDTYGNELGHIIRYPGNGYLMATQEFVMGSNPCQFLIHIPNCHLPYVDPGPQVAGAG